MYKAESGMITNAQGFRPWSERSQSDGFDRPIGREKTGDCTRCAIERTRRLLITFYGKKVIKRLITGADFAIGESRIAYRPYGEIDRVNSDGPDITRFKYTGQVEDSESRLLYYNARYYDPQIGTFISADSVVQPESSSGMNRFAYVSGNPVNSRDPGGNINVSHMFGQIIKHAARGGDYKNVTWQNAGKEYNHAKRENERAKSINTFINGGAEGAAAFFVLDQVARYWGHSKQHGTLFGHKYTWNGNRDQYSNFFSNGHAPAWAGGKKSGQTYLLFSLTAEALHIGRQYQGAYLNILPNLRANPKSFADRLAQRHDDDVPGDMGSGSKRQHRTAGAKYYKDWGEGLLHGNGGFWEQPIDSFFVGGGGSLLMIVFADDVIGRFFAAFD